MRRIRHSCVVVVVLALAGLAGPRLVGASGAPEDNILHEALDEALDTNCARMPGPKGPQLAVICASALFSDFTYLGTPAHLTGTLGVSTLNRGQVPTYLANRRRGTASEGGDLSGDASSHRSTVIGGKLGVFASFDYEGADKRPTRFEDGTTTNTFAGTFGADYQLTSWVLAGAAFTVAGQTGSLDADRGDFDSMAYGLTLYASFTPIAGLFVDVTLGGSLKDYSYQRAFFNGGFGIKGLINGDTSGDEVRVGLATGYDYAWGSVTIGPRFGLAWSHNTIDEYTERGSTGFELSFDKQHQSSLTLSFGVAGTWAVSTPFGVLVPQGSVEYVHEFMDDQRVIYFRFAQDGGQARFRFVGDPPDRNYFQMGLGASLQLAKGITPFVAYRALVGYKDHSAHSFSGGIRIAF